MLCNRQDRFRRLSMQIHLLNSIKTIFQTHTVPLPRDRTTHPSNQETGIDGNHNTCEKFAHHLDDDMREEEIRSDPYDF